MRDEVYVACRATQRVTQGDGVRRHPTKIHFDFAKQPMSDNTTNPKQSLKGNAGSSESTRSSDITPSNDSNLQWIILLIVVTGLFLWSYWPTLAFLIKEWYRVPDYSHGFLVIPIAAYFLWISRDHFVRSPKVISWAGVSLILLAIAVRVVGSVYYLEALQGWSIPIWITGVVWMFFGWQAFIWSLPGVAFLIFMVPLPYSIENMLSLPLQSISTKISLFILQCLGQPAIAEGTTISMGASTLEVARACSGLRIFFGITALAYAFILLFQRPIWTKLMLVLAILPITLASNSIRIVSIGLFMQLGMDETAQHLGHDLAGIFMIPLAAGLFGLTLLYLDKLFPVVSSFDTRSIMQTQSKTQRSS